MSSKDLLSKSLLGGRLLIPSNPKIINSLSFYYNEMKDLENSIWMKSYLKIYYNLAVFMK